MLETKRALKPYLDENRLIHIFIWTGILLPSLIKAGTPRFPRLFIQVMAMSLLFITLLYYFKQGKCKLSYSNIDILVIGFVFLAASSTLRVSYKHNAQSCFLLILSFAIFYFHIAGYFSITGLEQLWWGLIGLGIFESIIGFYQAIFLNESRITGTFHNPNHLSGFLTCLFMLTFARMIFNPSFRKNFVFKIMLILFMGSALFLTRSRGGLLALIGGSIGLVFLINAKKRAIFFLIAALILLAIIPNPLVNRLIQVQARDVYAYSRLSMWKSALAMLRDNPVFGVGLGNFGYFSYRYSFPVKGAWAKYARVARYAHNEFLHLGAEMGIPGILFLLIAIILFLKLAPRSIVSAKIDNNDCRIHSEYGDKKALLIGIVTLFSHSIVDFILHIPPLIFMLLILTAWIRKIGIADEDKKHFCFNLSGKGLRITLLICLIIPLILAWIPIREYLGYIAFNKANGNDLLSDIQYIKKAVNIDFGCAPYHNSLGGAYFKLYGVTRDPDSLEKGLKEAEIAQILNPDDYRFPLSLGRGYVNLHLIFPENKDILEKADKEFRKCLILAPYLYEGFLGLGKVLLYQNKPKDALNALKEAVRLEPYSMSSHYWLGLALDALGDLKSARSEYEKILEIKRLGLEKKAYIPYERQLIDFDMNKVYPKLKACVSKLE